MAEPPLWRQYVKADIEDRIPDGNGSRTAGIGHCLDVDIRGSRRMRGGWKARIRE